MEYLKRDEFFHEWNNILEKYSTEQYMWRQGCRKLIKKNNAQRHENLFYSHRTKYLHVYCSEILRNIQSSKNDQKAILSQALEVTGGILMRDFKLSIFINPMFMLFFFVGLFIYSRSKCMLQHNYRLSKIQKTSVTTLLFLVRPVFIAYIVIFVFFFLPTFTKHTTCLLPPPPRHCEKGEVVIRLYSMYNGHAQCILSVTWTAQKPLYRQRRACKIAESGKSEILTSYRAAYKHQ